ncbi:amidase signature enzyme [Dothidotthia symphoricarpi CBS 119687]|uniref:amidase n=1 Tax=Dothidotthia symphoricarpi CBS 119687 TaxID=1392245 RepID=A0A6A6A074_9PLEO|nr:amidase signature enzyme [Dothidotthia symphoricarpi CBS 119687]KAF2124553.1 amidase signature enzyme [Dothidotthia symphoricarpi CBS 119687]
MGLLEYRQHQVDCQRKQSERASKIAALPRTYLSPLSLKERTILGKSIQDLVQDVHKRVTSPVDILRAYGKVTIKAHEKTNCATEILFPEAEDWALNEVNLKGPLAGIPVSLKDSIQVKGFDSSVGYSRNTGKPAAEDGAMVKLLKDAGAVPFVKTNLPTTLLSFESTNDVWGQCKNPHNDKYSPGGSTGGEAALLAFGGSRIGIGSDVAGSVRAPAHFSGCYSLRCSTGRWPKVGMNTSMSGQEAIPSVFSPMARTLNDLTYFTRSFIQMQPWKYDYTVHPLAWRDDIEAEFQDKEKLRIGIMRTDHVVDPSPACARALSLAASALAAEGHEVFDVTPPSPYEALRLASQLLLSDGGATFMSHFRTGEWNDLGAAQMVLYMRLPRFIKYAHYLWVKHVQGDALWAGLLRDWHPKSAHEYWQLAGQREAYKQRFYAWWDETDMDVMLTPPNATPAVPHGGMRDAVSSCGYTFLFNLLDYTAGILPVTHVDPALDALPATFSLKTLNGVARGAYKHYDAAKMAGLPVAVQVVGRRLEEEKVLAVMERLEDALDEQGDRYELLEVD